MQRALRPDCQQENQIADSSDGESEPDRQDCKACETRMSKLRWFRWAGRPAKEKSQPHSWYAPARHSSCKPTGGHSAVLAVQDGRSVHRNFGALAGSCRRENEIRKQ